MRNIIIIIASIFLLSCSKKTSTDQNSLSELSDSSFVELPLHPDLLNAWNRYRELGMDKINDTAMCYIIDFFRNPNPLWNPNDSMCRISFNECGENYIGYKGMTNIDGHYVAVIDSGNIGKDFYNSKLLMQKDISDFKCYKSKRVKRVNGEVVFEEGVEIEVIGVGFNIKNNRIVRYKNFKQYPLEVDEDEEL